MQQLKFDNKDGGLTLKIDYSDEAVLLAGLPLTIAQYDVARGKRSKADVPGSTTKLSIRVKNNINQIPELERVEMTEMWTEEEKIPVKTGAKPAAPTEDKKDGEQPAEEAKAEPEEQKFEIKQRKKERTTEVPFKTVSHAIPPDLKQQFRNVENALMVEDRKILDLKEAKYNLESFTYEMKNGLDSYGNYEHFIDPALKQPFMDNLLATEQWIYADGENASLEDTQARLEALRAVGLPVKERYLFRQDFDDFVNVFEKFKKQTNDSVAETPHLTPE